MKSSGIFSGLLVWLMLLSLWAGRAGAQISVGPEGSGLNTFDTLPAASRWSTRAIGASANDFFGANAVAQLDAAVQTNSASLIAAGVGSNAANPPGTAASAQWSSAGRYLQTRTTGNAATMLMASLTNNSGTNLTTIGVNYTLSVPVAPAGEEIPGHAVYYSLSGLTNSWVALRNFFAAGNTVISISLASPWVDGSAMYLLFADDNSVINPDGAYQIDDFAVTIPFPAITSQPQHTSVAPGQGVTLTVSAVGAPPLFFQWRKNGASIDGATNQIFAIGNAQISDSGSYDAVVSNAFGVVFSSQALLTVACSTAVTITAQPQDQFLQAGGALGLSVTASGTQPLNYQWYRAGVAIESATNQTYLRTNALSAESGLYSVMVANCLGPCTSSNAVVSIAEPPYTLIGLTNYAWKYDQSGIDYGSAWRATNYDDSIWPQGPGLLAFENLAALAPLIHTVLNLFGPGGTGLPTIYFRAEFVLTNDPSAVTLVASNYFDDGAVVYLNGTEAFRYNMQAGDVSFNTLALAANPAGEGVFVSSNVPSSLIHVGTNFLAVEVHQNSIVSSDIAFGMEVRVIPQPPTLLRITNEPVDLVVQEQAPAAFIVGASGLTAHYQWFKDGVAIPGATSTTLSFSSALVADSGAYVFLASNAINVVTSRVARLVVQVDEGAPELLSADLLDDTHVLAVFSEPLSAGGVENLAQYSVTNTFGAVAVVLSAVLTNGTNVLLTTTALEADANYLLTAAGVPDGSLQHNPSALAAVPVARTFSLVSAGSYWDYLDPFPEFQSIDPGPGWNVIGYDTSSWGYDAGAFSFSQNPSFVPPVPVNTSLGITPVHTAYFRTAFSALLGPGGLTLKLSYAAADGVVFYLNGAELTRFNLPAGIPTATTPASVAVPGAYVSPILDLPGKSLNLGQNLLAAELHQFTTNDPQKFFAADLKARAESLLTGPLLLLGGPADAAVLERQPATFRVSQVAASAFQWQMNGTNLSGATGGSLTLLASMTLNGAQVRCVCYSDEGVMTSRTATLHVLPDLTRPALLSASINPDGSVTLSFSESLDIATASAIGNYQITNGAGAATLVTGVVLVNATNVVLSLASPLENGAIVVVNGVTDTAAWPNPVVPGSAAQISARYFIPFDAPWKYLLINTNEVVQSAFMSMGYDDSGWLGPGNGLLYVEEAALPGPKNTLLSLFDGTGVNRINTYYFRRSLITPLITTNLVMQVRHIIDDGMVLHLNGQEIYRYNMPAGTPTAATQSLGNIGDAQLAGPSNVPVGNLIAGTNVIAVEVHQNGATGSDVVMGVELDIQIPGGVLPMSGGNPLARLAMTPVGNQFLLSWGEPGFILERADHLNGPWLPIAMTSPAFASSSNAMAFFRLRR